MMTALNLTNTHISIPANQLSKAKSPTSESLLCQQSSSLPDSTKKSLKIDDWASKNSLTPSRKLDLMAALVDADDSTLDALLAALQQNREGYKNINSGRRKKSNRRARKGLNVQTYLERVGMWKPQRAFEPIEKLKWSAATHFAINCQDPKKIDAILQIAGINTDPKQKTVVRL